MAGGPALQPRCAACQRPGARRLDGLRSPVVSWRLPVVAAERGRELAGTAIAGLASDLSHRCAGLAEQAAGAAEPELLQGGVGGEAGPGFEGADQVVLADVRDGGQVVEGDVLIEVVVHVVDDQTDGTRVERPRRRCGRW